MARRQIAANGRGTPACSNFSSQNIPSRAKPIISFGDGDTRGGAPVKRKTEFPPVRKCLSIDSPDCLHEPVQDHIGQRANGCALDRQLELSMLIAGISIVPLRIRRLFAQAPSRSAWFRHACPG